MNCTQLEFDKYLESLGGRPKAFWDNFVLLHRQNGLPPQQFLSQCMNGYDIINNAFEWAKTAEGRDHWLRLAHLAREKLFDPEMFRDPQN